MPHLAVSVPAHPFRRVRHLDVLYTDGTGEPSTVLKTLDLGYDVSAGFRGEVPLTAAEAPAGRRFAVRARGPGGTGPRSPVRVAGDTAPRRAPETVTGAYEESGGLVAVDAVRPTAYVPGSGPTPNDWTPASPPPPDREFPALLAGRTGAGEDRPASGSAQTAEAVYALRLASPGARRVWVRLWAYVGLGDSAYVGLGGGARAQVTIDGTLLYGEWSWVAVDLPDAGAGDVPLTLETRETGLYVSRLVVALDPAYDPSAVAGGEGPPTSPLV